MIKERIYQFIYSDLYLAVLGIFTLISWQVGLDHISFYIIILVLLLEFIFLKDATPTIPVLFCALFLLSDTSMHLDTIPLHLYLAPIGFILGAVIHILKNKQRLFQGKLTLSIFILFLAMLLSMINVSSYDINLFFYAVIGISYAFVYFLYVGSIRTDHRAYLLKLFLMLGILVATQILLFYLSSQDLLLALQNKTLKLGWGISNYAATYLILFIPATVYFMKNSKYKTLFSSIFLFQLIMLLFTLSRAGILSFLAILPLLILYLILHKNWKKSFGNFLLILCVFLVLYFLNKEAFDIVFTRLLERGLDDSGRIELWKEAWEVFLAYPLFGGGIFARVSDTYRMYHNTFLHVLATMGLVGLIGLILQLITQFGVLIKNKSELSTLFFIALLGVHIHGLLDNIYLMPQFMVILMVIVAVFEYANKEKQIKKGSRS